MKLIIHLEVDNDAFQDGNLPEEVGRILADLAERLPYLTSDAHPLDSFTLRDANGNWCGEAHFEGSE